MVHSFSPVASPNARVLILGSMPGERSLKDAQYYAHPQNCFWDIMACLFDFSADIAYTEKCARLMSNKVALWDVLRSCERKGSLDSSIKDASVIVNDFDGFLHSCQDIRYIFFNGAKAESVFRRYIPADIQQRFPMEALQRLPSTSPAYAAMNRRVKTQKWSVMREALVDSE